MPGAPCVAVQRDVGRARERDAPARDAAPGPTMRSRSAASSTPGASRAGSRSSRSRPTRRPCSPRSAGSSSRPRRPVRAAPGPAAPAAAAAGHCRPTTTATSSSRRCAGSRPTATPPRRCAARASSSARSSFPTRRPRRVLLGRPDRPGRRQPRGRALGDVVGLIDTGPHCVLRVAPAGESTGAAEVPERLIPFVAAYVDAVEPRDAAASRSTGASTTERGPPCASTSSRCFPSCSRRT